MIINRDKVGPIGAMAVAPMMEADELIQLMILSESVANGDREVKLPTRKEISVGIVSMTIVLFFFCAAAYAVGG